VALNRRYHNVLDTCRNANMTKSTSSNEPFRYRSLDKVAKEIRIIVLHPAHSQSAEIQCDIWHTRLGRRCNYIALSYTWGDPEHKHTILVNSRKFEVTTNLRDALCYLRNAERPSIFWIDAICINQDDIDERNQQVQIMRDIYSGAECVYAWIGCADSFSPVAYNLIQNLATRISAAILITLPLLFLPLPSYSFPILFRHNCRLSFLFLI